MDLKAVFVYTTVATTLTLYPLVAAQTSPTTAAPNATGLGSVLGECESAWIGTVVSAGLFIVSEVLPFISKSPSNGVLHTIINGLKGAQKK